MDWMDAELVDIDKPAETWPDMLGAMFDDGKIDIIEVEENED